MNKNKNGNVVRYNRWGYYFLIPFVVVFITFQLIPLCSTIYNSFFEHLKKLQWLCCMYDKFYNNYCTN